MQKTSCAWQTPVMQQQCLYAPNIGMHSSGQGPFCLFFENKKTNAGNTYLFPYFQACNCSVRPFHYLFKDSVLIYCTFHSTWPVVGMHESCVSSADVHYFALFQLICNFSSFVQLPWISYRPTSSNNTFIYRYQKYENEKSCTLPGKKTWLNWIRPRKIIF